MTGTTSAADGPSRSPRRRPLRVSAAVELASLTVLLVNLATADVHQVAAVVGPLHGCAWLYGIAATWQDTAATRRHVLLAAVPGVGGLLALRALVRTDAAAAAGSSPPVVP